MDAVVECVGSWRLLMYKVRWKDALLRLINSFIHTANTLFAANPVARKVHVRGRPHIHALRKAEEWVEGSTVPTSRKFPVFNLTAPITVISLLKFKELAPCVIYLRRGFSLYLQVDCAMRREMKLFKQELPSLGKIQFYVFLLQGQLISHSLLSDAVGSPTSVTIWKWHADAGNWFLGVETVVKVFELLEPSYKCIYWKMLCHGLVSGHCTVLKRQSKLFELLEPSYECI